MEKISSLRLESVDFSYDSKQLVLKNLSFQLFPGQTLGVIGPNGGGKSTLTKILTGELIASQGRYFIGDQSITASSNFPFQLVSYLPQSFHVQNLLPVTVEEFIRFAGKNIADSIVQETLKKVDLWERRGYKLSQLSGGQLQKAVLAHALAKSPKILILDEPRSALDSTGQDQFLTLIKELKSSQDMAMVIVEHHIPSLTELCDQILCLNKTHHWHDTSELFDSKVMESIYHCELEHGQIHERFGPGEGHQQCTQSDEGHDHD